jgi:hypothetical protein
LGGGLGGGLGGDMSGGLGGAPGGQPGQQPAATDLMNTDVWYNMHTYFDSKSQKQK